MEDFRCFSTEVSGSVLSSAKQSDTSVVNKLESQVQPYRRTISILRKDEGVVILILRLDQRYLFDDAWHKEFGIIRIIRVDVLKLASCGGPACESDAAHGRQQPRTIDDKLGVT